MPAMYKPEELDMLKGSQIYEKCKSRYGYMESTYNDLVAYAPEEMK